MVKIHLVYYSMYGHIKKLADAYKAGAQTVEGVEVMMFRVAETLPQEVLDKMRAPPKAEDPVYDSHALPEADAFIFGFPTRFGTPAAQFKAMIDSTGALWSKGALALKPYSLFTSTATQGGGQETTMLGMVNNLTHHGMIFVPGGMACTSSLTNMAEVHGGSAWGAGTLAGPDGSRSPTEIELEYAKAAGAQLAKVAKKLAAP